MLASVYLPSSSSSDCCSVFSLATTSWYCCVSLAGGDAEAGLPAGWGDIVGCPGGVAVEVTVEAGWPGAGDDRPAEPSINLTLARCSARSASASDNCSVVLVASLFKELILSFKS